MEIDDYNKIFEPLSYKNTPNYNRKLLSSNLTVGSVIAISVLGLLFILFIVLCMYFREHHRRNVPNRPDDQSQFPFSVENDEDILGSTAHEMDIIDPLSDIHTTKETSNNFTNIYN